MMIPGLDPGRRPNLFLLEVIVGMVVNSAFINKYGGYLLIRDWAGLEWHPVLKVRWQLQDKQIEER